MRSRPDLRALQDRREARRDRHDDVRLRAEPVQIDGLERQPDLLGRFGEARQHFGMKIPADHPFEVALRGCRAHLEGRLEAGPDHAQHLRVLAGEPADRHGRGSCRSYCGQVIAADDRMRTTGIGIEQEYGRLMVGQTLLFVARPVAARLQAKRQSRPVEARLEAVERIRMPDRLADDREIVGVASRHGGEHALHGHERVAHADHVAAGLFRYDQHRRAVSTPCRAPKPATAFRPCRCARPHTSRGCCRSGRNGPARAAASR